MNHSFHRAVLVVSFGTSVHETRTKTLEAIEHCIQTAYPNLLHERAWTSAVLREKVLKSDDLKILGVQEALTKLSLTGVGEVYIQPTFITRGGEYQKLVQETSAFQHQFQRLCIGSPLMDQEADFASIIQAISQSHSYRLPASNELLLFMGHGTTDGDDRLYDQLDQAFKAEGYSHIFLKTMRSAASIDEIISFARSHQITKITLAPFMIVAGRHAVKDMAGDHADSWKSRLERAGFQVHCNMTGLGELPEIQRLFVHKLDQTGLKP